MFCGHVGLLLIHRSCPASMSGLIGNRIFSISSLSLLFTVCFQRNLLSLPIEFCNSPVRLPSTHDHRIAAEQREMSILPVIQVRGSGALCPPCLPLRLYLRLEFGGKIASA